MAAIGDTPTLPQPLLALPQVSIKLEQGVLHEEFNYGNAMHGGLNDLRNHDDSSHPPEKQDKTNELSSVIIKNEPALDIDDSYENINVHNISTFTPSPLAPLTPQTTAAHSPIIRIKPTTKLMPTPNPTNPKRRYECPYENCTKSYGKSSHLRSHLTWHTGVKPFVCQDPGCGKGFTRSDELNRHVRTHTGEKPFECRHCSKKFSRSDHLTKHLATHSKQMGVAMSHTSPSKRAKLESQRKESITPINISKSPSSPESSLTKLKDGMQTSNLMELYEGIHFIASCMPKIEPKDECMENHQENIDVQKSLETGVNNIRGKEENYYFNSHPHRSDVEPPNLAGVKTENVKYEEYDKDDDIKVLERNFDADEPDDDAIMPEANLPPLAISAMMASAAASSPPLPSNGIGLVEGPHQKDSIHPMYDPSRPLACNEWPKYIKQTDDLNRHMQTHTGEKPFACNECDKRFMRSDHLKKHLNTHTRIR